MAYGSTKLRAPREHLVSVPHIAHPKRQTVPAATGFGRQSGGQRPGLGTEAPGRRLGLARDWGLECRPKVGAGTGMNEQRQRLTLTRG